MANTIKSLQNNYLSYLQAQNSKINAFAPNTYWEIISGAEAGSFLDLYGNLQLIKNSTYIQNSVDDQVDLWLYRQGLPARGSLTFGTVIVMLTSTVPVTIAANTVFTDSVTGNKYQNLQTLTITSNSAEYILYSTIAGNNYIEPAEATLVNGAIQFEVVSSTNGQIEESDQSAIERVLLSIQSPLSGARASDYDSYARLASDQVTDVDVIIGFASINSVSILGVFIMQGVPMTEYTLNQGLISGSFVQYTRQADPAVITQVNNYIQDQRLVGLSVIVGTVFTYLLANDTPNPINISVSLVTGYSLASILTINSQDINNQPIIINITVGQLIQREARRAIVNQPLGGVVDNSLNYVTLNSIAYGLNEQLSSLDGNIAQILTNVVIPGTDIQVPDISYNAENVYFNYDIADYASIVVTQI